MIRVIFGGKKLLLDSICTASHEAAKKPAIEPGHSPANLSNNGTSAFLGPGGWNARKVFCLQFNMTWAGFACGWLFACFCVSGAGCLTFSFAQPAALHSASRTAATKTRPAAGKGKGRVARRLPGLGVLLY